jgi:hypothetical protein
LKGTKVWQARLCLPAPSRPPSLQSPPGLTPTRLGAPVKRGVTHWGRMQLPAFPRRLTSRLQPFAAHSSSRPAAHGQDAGSVIRRATCQSKTSDPPPHPAKRKGHCRSAYKRGPCDSLPCSPRGASPYAVKKKARLTKKDKVALMLLDRV